jgi:hypothetical protein
LQFKAFRTVRSCYGQDAFPSDLASAPGDPYRIEAALSGKQAQIFVTAWYYRKGAILIATRKEWQLVRGLVVREYYKVNICKAIFWEDIG